MGPYDKEPIILELAMIFQYHRLMLSKKIIVAGDGHFHLYPCYEPSRAFSNLNRNLGLLAALAPAKPGATRALQPGQDVFKIAFLAESRPYDYFHGIMKNEISFRTSSFEISAGPEEHCLSFSKDGRPALCLIAGRQIVTREKLEILGLGMEEIVPDGLAAGEVIEKIIAAGGLPVLAFSPGKWFFNRGRIAMKLAKRSQKSLLIGDSALRPFGWGEPEIMRRAKENNIAVLPGSDPLPLPGDEKYAGYYGFIYQGSFDATKPLTEIKEIMATAPQALLPAGRRCSFINVVSRLFRLWTKKM